ncbi:MAG: nitrilase-related carbon-nitrogen hydrolase, partial [Caulobacter sp.]
MAIQTSSDLPFLNPYRHGFVRTATCVPKVRLADPAVNARSILELVKKGQEQGVALMAFPELGLTGYSIDDLHHQDVLLDAVEEALAELAKASNTLSPIFVVGAPLRDGPRLFNCAIAIGGGRVLGATPKSFLPNYREFYEKRWF